VPSAIQPTATKMSASSCSGPPALLVTVAPDARNVRNANRSDPNTLISGIVFTECNTQLCHRSHPRPNPTASAVGWLKAFICCLLCCRDELRLVRALPPTTPARVGSPSTVLYFFGTVTCGQVPPIGGPRPATPCSIPNGGLRWSPLRGSPFHARPAERRGRARAHAPL
jgi:hypothetical protein